MGSDEDGVPGSRDEITKGQIDTEVAEEAHRVHRDEERRVTEENPQAAQEKPALKIKVRKPKQRACDERNEKGKLCAGHLKRWYFFGDEVKQKFGADAEIYRCEHCKTLYLPNAEEEPRTGTLSF